MNNGNISEIIKKRLKDKKLKQKDLANKLNVTDQAVSKWVRGLSYPDVSIMADLAKILDVPIKTLYDGKVNPDKKKISFKIIIFFIVLLVIAFLFILFLVNNNKKIETRCDSKAAIYETNDNIYYLDYHVDSKTFIFYSMYKYIDKNVYKTTGSMNKYISGKTYLMDNLEVNSCLNSGDLTCINSFKEKDIINKLIDEVNNSEIVEKKNSTLKNGIIRYDSPIYINDKEEYFWRTYIIQVNGNILYYKMDLFINNKSIRQMKKRNEELEKIIIQMDNIAKEVVIYQNVDEFIDIQTDNYFMDKFVLYYNDINAREEKDL